ncbi:pentapeptide repeat-containing protein [Spirulina sp. CS-785/01]|uniref:pentapeptide repeat-containing protein n=1 Tax=Spirulina sp. CS-785/01 TaxID=3021716 RepID=UPI00232D37D1|nr:pentapeptide repeat-containing protein [Spirulina sp. CS-785/01]MDB9315230.1 pentapeptide repeat-containing protein [Spirulina sp. CS-785/01]
MSLSLRQWLADRQIALERLLDPSANVAGVAFRIVQDMEVKSLTPFDISPVVDILELPLAESWRLLTPMTRLTVALLRLLSRKKPLKRSEGTWLTFQIAYLNTLHHILTQEIQLGRPWLNRAVLPGGTGQDQDPLEDAKLHNLLKTLRPGKLSDSQAEQALSALGESFLVQQMNQVCLAWLVANGAEAAEAKLMVQRLCHGLAGFLLAVVVDNAPPLAQLQKFVRLGLRSTRTEEERANYPLHELEPVLDIPREHYRSQLLKTASDPLFGELFTLTDIYVPPKASVVDEQGNTPPSPDTDTLVDLQRWADEQLGDLESIAVIEGEWGWGKTSFCQRWARQIAWESYPDWQPVLISLRDTELGQNLEDTLARTFPLGRFRDEDGWLSGEAPPCLLILDGLDELPRSPHKFWYIRAFLDQVIQFHSLQLKSGSPRHKIVLTSRFSTFEGLSKQYRIGSTFPLQAQFKRIRMQPMDRGSLQRWFKNWSRLQSKSISYRYFTLLKEEGLFHRSTRNQANAELVHHPLTLYLLGILHRDGLLDAPLFQLPHPQARYEMYERMTRWLLGEPQGRYQLPEVVKEGMAHASRSTEAIANLLTGDSAQERRQSMQKTALELVQTGRGILHFSSSQGEDSLETQPMTVNLAFSRNSSEGSPLSLLAPSPSTIPDYPLPALFFTVSGQKVAFSHPSLGAYLAANQMAQQLKQLTKKERDRYGWDSFTISSPQAVAEHLYLLLGYGVLSPEIETLLIESLEREEQRNTNNFSFVTLFQRLNQFYHAYCQGCWIDEGVAQLAYQHLQRLNNPLNTLQVDAVVGLNVFVLLSAIARNSSLPFYPCGHPHHPHYFEADRFLLLMSRTMVLSPTCFLQRVRGNLTEIQLPGAYLKRIILPKANLERSNLTIADLTQANLVNANLSYSNLAWANLSGANLSGCNLTKANLEGADFRQANLHGAKLNWANLNNACFYQAQLDPKTEQRVRESGAFLSLDEFYKYSQSLVSKLQLGEVGNSNLYNAEPKLQIEIAEGKPDLPDPWQGFELGHPASSPEAATIADANVSPPTGSEDATLAAPDSLLNIGSEDETLIAGDYPPNAESEDATIPEHSDDESVPTIEDFPEDDSSDNDRTIALDN